MADEVIEQVKEEEKPSTKLKMTQIFQLAYFVKSLADCNLVSKEEAVAALKRIPIIGDILS